MEVRRKKARYTKKEVVATVQEDMEEEKNTERVQREEIALVVAQRKNPSGLLG